jgi:mRNA interferase RelE/StbE
MSRKRNGRPPRPAPRRFEIRLTRAAERSLAALGISMLHRIDTAILGLSVAPHPPGSKKLRGAEDLYRIRVGDHRIIYQVDDKRLVVLIINIGHRRDIYRDR